VRKYWELLKADYRAHKALFLGVGSYWFVAINDYISSLVTNSMPGIIETNPYMRDTALHFVLWKGFFVDSCFFTAFMAAAMLGKWAIDEYNEKLANAVAAGILIYIAADRFILAVIPNWFIRFHLEVSDTPNGTLTHFIQHLVNP